MLEALAELFREEGLSDVSVLPPTDRTLPLIKAGIDRIAITIDKRLFGISLFNSTIAVTPVMAMADRPEGRWNDRASTAFFELGDPNCVQKAIAFMRQYGSS